MNKQFASRMPEDLPDSPIPAWRHYYICRDTDEMIRKELEAQNPDTLMAGVSVGYRFIPSDQPADAPGKFFPISYGYLVECDDEDVGGEGQSAPPDAEARGTASEQGAEEGRETGLNEEFIDRLYEQVREWILRYAPERGGEYLVSLEVTSAHFSKPKLKCQGRKCGFCSKHNKKHILKRVTRTSPEGNAQCAWVCTGNDCGS